MAPILPSNYLSFLHILYHESNFRTLQLKCPQSIYQNEYGVSMEFDMQLWCIITFHFWKDAALQIFYYFQGSVKVPMAQASILIKTTI